MFFDTDTCVCSARAGAMGSSWRGGSDAVGPLPTLQIEGESLDDLQGESGASLDSLSE